MQSLKNCDLILEIELIESISGGNREFEIIFSTRSREKYKMIFRRVWDLRYSVENASIYRFCEFRKCLPEGIVDNSIYIVENSEYIKYFEQQVSGTYLVDDVIHYILSDNIDTFVDILAIEKPMLVKI